MKKDLIMHGIRIGEYVVVPEKVIDQINRECIDKGMNYVAFSVGSNFDTSAVGRQYFIDWAKHLTEHKVYFSFTGNNPQSLGIDEETALKVKEIAGEYYLGNMYAEIGSDFGCKGSEYGVPNTADNVQDGKLALDRAVEEKIAATGYNGKIPATIIEATGLLPYVASKQCSFPVLETMCGNPEIMIPMTRGAAKAINSPIWATYIAHEWYGGTRAFDTLKMHRLRMIYDYAYMSGSNAFVLESGDECLYAHETHANKNVEGVKSPLDTIYNYDHPICQQYRQTLKDFADFLKTDERPVGGPKVKVAFVQGNLDGFSPWRGGSSLWNCYGNKDFGHSAPEFVWRIFDDIATKRTWCDTHNFGEVDLSGAPAYGTYDVIQAASGYETFAKYDYLIFTGWNTMTEEIYENLKKFVYGGGRLFMAAAHLNTSIKRNGEMKLIHDGKVADLFGCDLDVENVLNINHGYKFLDSIVPEYMYPRDLQFDPLFSEGYANYAKVEMKGGHVSAILSQAAFEKDISRWPIGLAENKYGSGYATLLTTLDYPSGSTYAAYKAIVREIITASHRIADVKVYGVDKLRFTVYEGNKIYLLNTDFDSEIQATIDYGNEKKVFTLKPRELKVVE